MFLWSYASQTISEAGLSDWLTMHLHDTLGHWTCAHAMGSPINTKCEQCLCRGDFCDFYVHLVFLSFSLFSDTPLIQSYFSFTFVQYKTKSELLICKPKPSITHSDTSGKTTSVCSFSVAINDTVPTVHGTLGHSGFPAADDIPLSATGFHYGPLNS